jgi:hypothetical protein
MVGRTRAGNGRRFQLWGKDKYKVGPPKSSSIEIVSNKIGYFRSCHKQDNFEGSVLNKEKKKRTKEERKKRGGGGGGGGGEEEEEVEVEVRK